MRNATVKYSGAFTAVIGLIMLALLGSSYAWGSVMGNVDIEASNYSIYALIGVIILACGLLAYIFVEE